MFDLSIQELNLEKENTILKKSINLDENLDCFIIISSKDNILAENILNNIIENIIDKISKTETYNDFGIALENINSFLKTWRTDNPISDGEKQKRLDIVISILNENNFMFSNIGKTSAYMINGNNEIIELTEKGENKKDFLYISNGDLANGDIIITSTINLLKYLSKSDLEDSMILSDDMDIFSKNLKNILKTEILNKNCLLTSMRYENEFFIEEDTKITSIKNTILNLADTKIVKKSIGAMLIIKDKINLQSKKVKNIIFIGIISLAIILLYFIISKIAGQATKTEVKQEVKSSITEIKQVIANASENVGNPEIFRKNIKNAEDMIKTIEEKKLFSGDIKKLNDEINILKNQFNKVEVFEATNDNKIYTGEISQSINIIKHNGKVYIITKKGIIGPIINGRKTKIYTFNDLKEKEYFTDYATIGNNIFLLTNNSKIVRFTSNGRFNFVNVSGQASWEDIKSIDSYSTNLYSLGKDNQIYKHKALTKDFSKKSPYLKEGDKKQIGEILDIAIDGGFYILKKDLTIVKFFSSPYRIESLTLSKLPKNYNIEGKNDVKIKAGFKLKYVYMLLNNKIWVFKTNSRNYQNTRDLAYMGQIEGSKNKIIDFFVESDGEIIVLNKEGVYKLKFEVSDNKIIVR